MPLAQRQARDADRLLVEAVRGREGHPAAVAVREVERADVGPGGGRARSMIVPMSSSHVLADAARWATSARNVISLTTTRLVDGDRAVVGLGARPLCVDHGTMVARCPGLVKRKRRSRPRRRNRKRRTEPGGHWTTLALAMPTCGLVVRRGSGRRPGVVALRGPG